MCTFYQQLFFHIPHHTSLVTCWSKPTNVLFLSFLLSQPSGQDVFDLQQLICRESDLHVDIIQEYSQKGNCGGWPLHFSSNNDAVLLHKCVRMYKFCRYTSEFEGPTVKSHQCSGSQMRLHIVVLTCLEVYNERRPKGRVV